MKNARVSNLRQIFLDFEFSRTTHEFVNLVSCVTYDRDNNVTKKFWLHNKKQAQKKLKKYLQRFDLVIGYAVVAEARSFISLALDPMDFKWIDMFVEYRMLTNHNDELSWGRQLVDGKVKKVNKPRPKWERTEQDKFTSFRATHSLAEATYKLTGEIRDTEHKDKMRDLIISDPPVFKPNQRKSILSYNVKDVKFLPVMFDKIVEWNLKLNTMLTKKKYMRQAMERAEFMAATAWMESKGYPIDLKKTQNFSKQVNSIIFEVQREINNNFPDIKPFRWDKRQQRYAWNQVATKNWIQENHDTSRWMKTKKKAISLSLEAFEQHYQFKHDYPEDNFGAQMVRYLKLKQNLFGFGGKVEAETKVVTTFKKKKSKTFFDSVGPDGLVRPYLNPYGAQSSRSQPGSTGFMYLKPAWMRALVQPPKGTFMGAIDFGSEEFLISALKSEDMAMIEAYMSGDPYYHFAKLARAVPSDSKRDENNKKTEAVRDAFKSTTLGMSYDMTNVGLAKKLTADTKKVWTEDQAQEMVELFQDSFPDFYEFKQQLIEDYQAGTPIILADGWTMWTGNINMRSVGNCPIQGEGGVIMRRAVVAAMKKGIYIPFPLHDALYMWGKTGTEKDMLVLRECMRDAFVSVFPKHLWKYAEKIRLDPKMWGYQFEKKGEIYLGKEKWKVPVSPIHIDKRALSEYNKFSKYFEDRIEDQL